MAEATRTAFRDALVEAGRRNPDILVFDADLSKSTGSAGFKQAFPLRFRDFGIAEANMIGSAAGAGLCGKNVFACSFACFLTGRYEQIRMSVVYNRANVKLVGTHAGVGVGEDGYSQQGLEDVALMRVLPGMMVLQPADGFECRQMVAYLAQYEGPAYLRLTRQAVEDVHDIDYRFAAGKADVLRHGCAVMLMASGAAVAEALKAANLLEKVNIDAGVANISSIKPIDKEFLAEVNRRCKRVVTIEDHNTVGGLAGAVSEALMAAGGVSLLRLGINEAFGESGTQKELYRHFGIDGVSIAEKVIHWLEPA